MGNVWTYGNWIVKPGSEEGFVQAWSRLARESTPRFGSSRPTLLRDREKPNVFTSFGAWPSLDVIQEFRESDMFKAAVAEIQPLLESFEAMTLDEIEWT
jgi:quinol monooxygenase YgiN